MGIKRISTVAVALAGAGALAFAGTASAATAVEATATADNQLCGTVWDDEGGTYPWQEFGVPSGAQGVAGVTISGTLNGVPLTPITPGTTNPTLSNGTYCLQADSSMASAVLAGGSVVLTATAPAGWSVTSPNPWSNWAGTNIQTLTFLGHLDSSYTAATNFNFTVGN